MKRIALPWAMLLVACLGCGFTPGTLPPIEVHFSPKGGCTEAVVGEINAAKTSVLVQAYSFTSAPIAKAIVDAHRRGVQVQTILDRSHRTEEYSSADFLLHEGVSVRIDDKHAIAHNKIMIIDDQVVVTGSFNFTKAAEEHNAENLLVIRDPALAAEYTANWKVHAAHSGPYTGKDATATQSRAKPHGPPAKPPQGRVATGGFVSSVNSQVFHRPGCDSAAKISPRNLEHYATRAEAIQAGKKPCHECAP